MDARRARPWISLTRARSSLTSQVAAGKPPIEMPVTLMLDNHHSRFDETVLAECEREEIEGHAEALGIRLFFEESNTSHFLQMLDKIFEKLHKAYKAGLNEYKAQYRAKCAAPASPRQRAI